MGIGLRSGVGLVAAFGIFGIPALGQQEPPAETPAKAPDEASSESTESKVNEDAVALPVDVTEQSELWELLIDQDLSKTVSRDRALDVQSGGNDPVPLRQGSEIKLRDGLRLDLGMTRFDMEDNPGVDFISVDPSLGAFGSVDARMKVYDFSLAWDAYQPGPVTLSVLGGVKAVTLRARVNNDLLNDAGAFVGSQRFETNELVPVPVVGGAVKWDISPGAWVRGTGTGHGLGDVGAYLDLTAEAGLRLTNRADMTAGYRFRQGQIDVNQFDADMDASSLFAKLQFRF